jgi:hypothetical protein
VYTLWMPGGQIDWYSGRPSSTKVRFERLIVHPDNFVEHAPKYCARLAKTEESHDIEH